jgi:fructan beta-fructosidase
MKFKIHVFLFFALLFSACKNEIQTKETEIVHFNEPFRPQFHFSPPTGWMNDPNGMVFLDGEYHLFYQFYPDSTVWGPMHWGHAISRDLVNWEHLPIALEPDEHGWIFSGSAVIDHNNSSGLGSIENPAMVAIYTYHDPVGEKEQRNDFQTQGIAYSNDKGRSWKKYAENPVLKNPGIRDFRDPKVMWLAEENGKGKWLMSLAVLDKISFYSSPNLLDWSFESDFNPDWAAYGGVWECPDLFPLKTDDGTVKWILFVSINPGGPQGGSATQYFIGDFDGKTFITESLEVKWLDHGADNYAGVTWSNIPESDGRKIFIGWMSNWQYAQVVPTSPWRSAMTVPRNLELVRKGSEYLVASRPVMELEKLRTKSQIVTGQEINLENELIELELIPDQPDFIVTFYNDKNEKVTLEHKDGQLLLDRSQSGITGFNDDFKNTHMTPVKGTSISKVRIFLDRSSIEIFFNEGEITLTELVFPTEYFSKVRLEGFKHESKIHNLKSIW